MFIWAPKCRGNFSNVAVNILFGYFIVPVKLNVEEQLLPAQPENEDPSN